MSTITTKDGTSIYYKDWCPKNVIYVGLGDQFDDDRRLVREAAPTSLSTWQARRNAQAKPLRK